MIADFPSVVHGPEIICTMEGRVCGRIRGPGSFIGRSNQLLLGSWKLSGSHRLRNNPEAARPPWTVLTELEVLKQIFLRPRGRQLSKPKGRL